MPGAIGHQRGKFLMKPCIQALLIGTCVTLKREREVRDGRKRQTSRDVFFSLFGLCCFSIIMLHTIKQQCHKPTDLHVTLKKDKIFSLLFAVGLVGRRFLVLPWVLTVLVAPSPGSCPVEILRSGTRMRPSSSSLGK